MPSKRMVAGLWGAALVAIIVAGFAYGTRIAPSMFAVAAVLTVTAAWLELTERIDDDT
jgi:preprotein translocase subunit SecD